MFHNVLRTLPMLKGTLSIRWAALRLVKETRNIQEPFRKSWLIGSATAGDITGGFVGKKRPGQVSVVQWISHIGLDLDAISALISGWYSKSLQLLNKILLCLMVYALGHDVGASFRSGAIQNTSGWPSFPWIGLHIFVSAVLICSPVFALGSCCEGPVTQKLIIQVWPKFIWRTP